MIGLEFFSRVGSIRKSIKNLYLKKIISLAIAVLLLLPKTCFFLKLITPKLNGQFSEKNHDNAEYKLL